MTGEHYVILKEYGTAAPTGQGYSRHDRHQPNNTPSLQNVMPTRWACYNSPNGCPFSQTVLWRSHVTYFISPLLKQTLKLAKNVVLKLPFNTYHEKKKKLIFIL